MNEIAHDYLKNIYKQEEKKPSTSYLIKENNGYLVIAPPMLGVNFLVISSKTIKVT